jgi:hypothetical protein
MALLFIDGFDMYNGLGANIGLASKWNPLSGNPISLVTGRFGGQAVRFANVNTGTGCDRPITAGTTFSFGCAIRLQAFPGGTPTQKGHLQFYKQGAFFQCGILFDTAGAISAYRLASDTSGTLLGTSSAAVLAINVWAYVECEVVISTTVGRITVYVNGTQVLNLTGVNTANGGVGTTADTFRFASVNGGNAPTIDMDDLYVTNSATKLGERRVETLRPSSDSTPLNWTPDTGTAHFSRVNATLAQSTTFVQTSTVNDLDLYNLADLSSTPGVIDAVQYNVFAQKTDATGRAIASVGDLSGVQDISPNMVLGVGVGKFEYLAASKPGGGAWTPTDVNALKIGPKVIV